MAKRALLMVLKALSAAYRLKVHIEVQYLTVLQLKDGYGY